MSALDITFALLKSSAEVLSLVGANGIYPDEVPEAAAMPAVAYEVVGETEFTPASNRGTTWRRTARVQISVVCEIKKVAQREQLMKACTRAVVGQNGTTVGGHDGVATVFANGGPVFPNASIGLTSQSFDVTVSYLDTA